MGSGIFIIVLFAGHSSKVEDLATMPGRNMIKGEEMKLQDIVENINELDDSLTIYAEMPWSCSSKAALAIESEDGSLPAELESKEFTYFLEVFIAKEFLEDWAESMSSVVSAEQRCVRLIKYAEDDA